MIALLDDRTRRLLCVVLETEHEASSESPPDVYVQRMLAAAKVFIRSRVRGVTEHEALEIWKRERELNQ